MSQSKDLNKKNTFQGKTRVVFNRKVAPGHYVIRLRAPLLARITKPGQFVQIHVGAEVQGCRGIEVPFLRRPFSLLATTRDAIDILYAVVGKGTQILARKRSGESVDVLGPLGNRWTAVASKKKAIMIGGGVGIPPLYFLAREAAKHRNRIEVFLGSQNKSLLLCQKDFQRIGVQVHTATDDGSAGFKGYVTELLEQWFRDPWPVARGPQTKISNESRVTSHESPYLYSCGPEPMLKAVAQLASEMNLDGEVSMEAPMACGFGICVGCAVPVVGGKYKLCCYDGSVFKIDEIDWGKI